METAYAQALWMVIARGMVPARAVRALHNFLERQGRAALMPRIARAYSRIAMRENARSAATLFLAREDDARAKKAALKTLREADIDTTGMRISVDETLVGGWRLEGRGKLIDASFRKILLDIYNGAIK